VSQTFARINALEGELTVARQEAAAEQRNQLISQLTEARERLRTTREQYAIVRNRVKSERAARAKIQGEIDGVLFAISESWSARPPCADFLPNDAEVVEWRTHHDALEEERTRLIQQRDELPQTHRSQYDFYEGGTGLLAQLEYREKSLLAALNGIPASPVGGIYGV